MSGGESKDGGEPIDFNDDLDPYFAEIQAIFVRARKSDTPILNQDVAHPLGKYDEISTEAHLVQATHPDLVILYVDREIVDIFAPGDFASVSELGTYISQCVACEADPDEKEPLQGRGVY